MVLGDMQQHYAENAMSDYVQAAVNTAVSIHEQDLPGDILIFLTGQEECEAAVSMLEAEARRFRRAQGNSLRLMPLALYAGLPAASQLQAFEMTPRGYRKVLPGVSPCCYVKYAPNWGMPRKFEMKLSRAVLCPAVPCCAVSCCAVLPALLNLSVTILTPLHASLKVPLYATCRLWQPLT